MNKKLSQFLYTLITIFVLVFSAAPLSTASAQSTAVTEISNETTLVDISPSAPFCQCVVYVKNTYKLSGSAGYAKDMGPFLNARGFRRVYSPTAGDIIIMKQPFGHGIGYAGHVAILKSLQLSSDRQTMTITIRGANQGSRGTWIENNCNNVSFWGGISYPALWGGKYVEYWRKK